MDRVLEGLRGGEREEVRRGKRMASTPQRHGEYEDSRRRGGGGGGCGDDCAGDAEEGGVMAAP